MVLGPYLSTANVMIFGCIAGLRQVLEVCREM